MAVSNGAWFCIIFLAICVIICLIYYIQTIYIKFRLRKAYKQQQAQILASSRQYNDQEQIVETTSDTLRVFSIDHQINQRDQLLCGNTIQEASWDYNNVPIMTESSVENNSEDILATAEQFRQSHRQWMQQQWARINEPYEEPSPILLRRNTNQRSRNRGNIVEATNNNLVQEPRCDTTRDIANLTNAYSNQRVDMEDNDTDRWANDFDILRNIGFMDEITELTEAVFNDGERSPPPRYSSSSSSRFLPNVRQTEEVVERTPDPVREDTGRVVLDPDHARRMREMHLQCMEPQSAYGQDSNPSAYENQRQLRNDQYRRPAAESQPSSRNRVEATNNLVQETRNGTPRGIGNLAVALPEENTERNASDPEIIRNIGFIHDSSAPRELHYENGVPPPRHSSLTNSDDVTPLVLEASHLLERLPPNLLETEDNEGEVLERPSDPGREDTGRVVLDPDNARRIRERHLQWMEAQWAYGQDSNPSAYENQRQLRNDQYRRPAAESQPSSRNRVEATNNLVQETRNGTSRGIGNLAVALPEENTERNASDPEIIRNIGFIHDSSAPRELHYENGVPPPRYSSLTDSDDATPLVLEASHLLERLPPNLLQTEEVIERPSDSRRDDVGTVVLDPDHARRIREMHLQWMETQWAYEQDNNPSMLENENQVRGTSQTPSAPPPEPQIERIQPNERPRRIEERSIPSNPRRSNIGRVVLAPDHTNRIRQMHHQWNNDQINNPTAYAYADDIHRRVITGSGRSQIPILNQEPPPSYDMPPSYEEAMKSLHL